MATCTLGRAGGCTSLAGTWRGRVSDPVPREFRTLFAGIDQRLDQLGMPVGQPFLISPAGKYDAALNRYYLVGLASSPWNMQAAHARDLRTYFDFPALRRGRSFVGQRAASNTSRSSLGTRPRSFTS